MSNSVATKKYVKAIMDSFKNEELNIVKDIFRSLSLLFSNQKFSTIISSPDVDKNSKNKFVLSMIDSKNKKIENLLSILNENGRLELIPSIYNELKLQIAKLNNFYIGKITSNSTVSNEQISVLEKKLSDKFQANIKLEVVNSDYPGIKIELDDLGVETSFSLDRLKTQITEHILKAI